MVNGSKIPGKNGVDACFGKLTAGYGSGCGAMGPNNMGAHFGPELGFGIGMSAGLPAGEKYLIMKVCYERVSLWQCCCCVLIFLCF